VLYLIRHADAVDSEPDSERALSERGRGEIRRLANFLRAGRPPAPEEIWHSPFLRARDTAALLAADLGWTARAQVVPGLEPDDALGPIAARIAAAERPLAIVGHNPHLAKLSTLLVTGAAEPEAFIFPKCAVLVLEPGLGREPGAWLVRWMVGPELLP
jgi:phosphohistidine phosphatase